MLNYEKHLKDMHIAAATWEEWAEAARREGNLSIAHLCSERAIRCHFLADLDPDIEAFFRQQLSSIKPFPE